MWAKHFFLRHSVLYRNLDLFQFLSKNNCFLVFTLTTHGVQFCENLGTENNPEEDFLVYSHEVNKT